VQLPDRNARDPRHADAAPGLFAALADRQAPRLARPARDQEGIGLAPRFFCQFRKSSTISTTPPSAGITGIPVIAENSAIARPKSASACENFVAQVTPISSSGG